MLVFVFTGHDKPNSHELRKATRPAHLEWIRGFGARVKLGGPILADDGATPVGSVIFLECADLADAKATFASDPYAKAGLWADTEVRQFNVVGGGFK
jgi:uncharacterized protein YciI